MYELELSRLPRSVPGRRALPVFLCLRQQLTARISPFSDTSRPPPCSVYTKSLSRKTPGCLSLRKVDLPSPLPEHLIPLIGPGKKKKQTLYLFISMTWSGNIYLLFIIIFHIKTKTRDPFPEVLWGCRMKDWFISTIEIKLLKCSC